MELYLEQLVQEDAEKLYAFECENRSFFEIMVPGRGDDYYRYHTFLERHQALLDEQRLELSFFFLIKDKSGEILGRLNLVDIDKGTGTGHIGYRVGEAFTGRGIAERSVNLLLRDSEKYHVKEIQAKTTVNNIPSQKVLLRNGFLFINSEEDPHSGETFLCYVWSR
ncbi:GNAT family N-acetyltransferase [Bacillus salacetis]|uniref:GNAT family N-acetyltransferase n=1 Tax=Bacillus salacetis TaxID=2315464 RepID=UPI003BA0824A